MSSTIQLPDKPSELIRLALSDLRKCEANPRYRVDMGEWHSPSKGVCHVCLAGAVMAQTGKVSPRVFKMPFQTKYNRKYSSLDHFRSGSIHAGLRCLDIWECPEGIPDCVNISRYEDNPTQFHLDMESLAALLQNHGL